jgi:hypothetical protein
MVDLKQIDKQIEDIYEKLFENEHGLHEKLEELINDKEWDDPKLRKEIESLDDTWVELQHNVFALEDKKEGKPHDPECMCGFNEDKSNN